MSIKNWKTDIRIKLPRLHIIRPNHYHVAAEEVTLLWLKIALPLSPFGLWKVIELVKEFLIK